MTLLVWYTMWPFSMTPYDPLAWYGTHLVWHTMWLSMTYHDHFSMTYHVTLLSLTYDPFNMTYHDPSTILIDCVLAWWQCFFSMIYHVTLFNSMTNHVTFFNALIMWLFCHDKHESLQAWLYPICRFSHWIFFHF